MSDATKNFSLRLSAEDQLRLEQVAERLAVDRTGALRLLIRRAAVGLAPGDPGGRTMTALPSSSSSA